MNIHRQDRGQTTFDFVLGISILLISIAFVFMMAPNLFTPFAEGQSADPLISDRVADHLIETELVGSSSTGELDSDKVEEFFEPEGGLNDDLQVNEFRSLNVQLVDSEGTVVESRGEDIPSDSGKVTHSQRVAVYDDEIHRLHVRVW